MIRGAVADRRLHRVFRGAYAVGHAQIGARGRMFAATLACGDGAVISHRSAAHLLALLDRPPLVVDVIAPGSRGREIDGIRPHLPQQPDPVDLTRVEGIPCTTTSRTLVDLAAVVGERTLRRCFERAAAARRLDLDRIEAILARGRRRGGPTLRRLLREWRPVGTFIPNPRLRSPFEAKVLPLLARSELPRPLANAVVQTPEKAVEVDLLWPGHRLAVEWDSRRHHGTDIAFERDRRRNRELMRVGYATLRVTWREAEEEAAAVLDAIRAELALRRPLLEAPTAPRPTAAATPAPPS